MSAEDWDDEFYYGADHWYEDDSVSNIVNIQQAFLRSSAPCGHTIVSLDMKKAEAKVAALTKTVQLPDEKKIIKNTKKAILFLLPNQQKLWVPKYGIVSWVPHTTILSKFWIAPDDPAAQYANPVQLNHVQPRCPYCGERDCAC